MTKRRILLGLLVLTLLIPIVAYLWFQWIDRNSIGLDKVLRGQGFAEFRPPSNLVIPGTWVTVEDSDPLELGVVCSAETALGVSREDLSSSASIDVNFSSKLTNDFELDAKLISALSGTQNLNLIRSLTFRLKNVELLEISDETAIAGLTRRTEACREAIKFRIEAKTPITMIKSALVADVEYVVEIDTELGAEGKAELADDLALKMELKLAGTTDRDFKLSGTRLIWGIREDVSLAYYGIGLPATGGYGRSTDNIIPLSKPISQVEYIDIAAAPIRRVYSPDITIVRHDVKPLKQQGSNDCWATVYAMMETWRVGHDVSVNDAVGALEARYTYYFVNNTGLPGGQELEFVRAANMIAEPPAAYMLDYYSEMLSEYGPLWIITGDGISSHALLMVGTYGSYDSTEPGFSDDLIFEFIDPLLGEFVYKTASEFVSEFEQEAFFLNKTNQADVDLRWQILHYR